MNVNLKKKVIIVREKKESEFEKVSKEFQESFQNLMKEFMLKVTPALKEATENIRKLVVDNKIDAKDLTLIQEEDEDGET